MHLFIAEEFRKQARLAEEGEIGNTRRGASPGEVLFD
jgi:hypothetical protein